VSSDPADRRTTPAYPWSMAAHAPLDPQQFRTLPEPVSLDDTVSEHESLSRTPEMDDEWREVQWLLKVTGGF